MSTRVGALQAPKAGGPILLAAVLASFVILTIAVVAIPFDREPVRQGETTIVGRQLVNTPTELSAGGVGAAQTSVGSTAANTPSELNVQIGAARPKTVAGGTLATATELSGAFVDAIPAEFHGCQQLPAEFYACRQVP